MLKKLYTDKNLSLQILILVCLQPLIDIYRLFVENAIEIAGISLVELINILFVGYLTVLFILNKQTLKRISVLFIYAAVVGVYIVAHCYNILQFDTSIMNGTEINVFKEIYVIVRAYIIPVVLLYMMVSIKTEKDLFLKTSVAVSAFISGVVFFTNIFKVSYVSYASHLEKQELIRQNIFEWFFAKAPDDINLITSKGWFYSGNQVGLVLLMLFPIVIYYFLHSKKKIGCVFIFIQLVAMIMVSTKTAAYGSFLVLAAIIILLVLFGIKDKCFKENLKRIAILGVVFILGFGILLKSPVIKMTYNSVKVYEQNEITEQMEAELEAIQNQEVNETDGEVEEGETGLSAKEFSIFINKYYNAYSIHKEYLELLPADKYMSFWMSVINDPSKSQINFRNFKVRLYNVVIGENNNSFDRLLGIGYTSNFPYTEKDIISQNIWFGITGTILLLGPFFIVFIVCAFLILKNFKKCFTLYNCILGISICAGTAISFIAGHLFGFFFPVIIYTFILSELKHSVCDNKKG